MDLAQSDESVAGLAVAGPCAQLRYQGLEAPGHLRGAARNGPLGEPRSRPLLRLPRREVGGVAAGVLDEWADQHDQVEAEVDQL